MKMASVRKKAKELGLKTGRRTKAKLIRDIQAAEGNPVCFRTDVEHCDQHECCWREDCLPQLAEA